MTQDEIINMARQARIEVKEPSWGYSESYSFSCFEEAFERFAKLVAQHEREACAKVCEELSKDMTPIAEQAAKSCATFIRGQE